MTAMYSGGVNLRPNLFYCGSFSNAAEVDGSARFVVRDNRVPMAASVHMPTASASCLAIDVYLRTAPGHHRRTSEQTLFLSWTDDRRDNDNSPTELSSGKARCPEKRGATRPFYLLRRDSAWQLLQLYPAAHAGNAKQAQAE